MHRLSTTLLSNLITVRPAWSFVLIFGLLNAAARAHDASTTVSPLANKSKPFTSPDQTPAGLMKSDWASIRAAHAAWEQGFMPLEGGGWQARNPGQQWTAEFDGRGFVTRPKAAHWQWGLELRSYGFGNRQHAVKGRPEVQAEGQHLSYQWDTALREWFVNDTRGLEHGFTLTRRPQGAVANEALEVVLSTRGTLKARVAADAQTVHFRDESGAPVVTYAGLKVWDADGQVLPSWFLTGSDGGIVLRVEEGAARYPITIDPVAQQAYVKPESPLGHAGADDQFGSAVAVSGDTVVVGARREDSSSTGINSAPNESSPHAGAAYVFVRSGTTWSQQAYLKASQVSAGDNFGISVAVSGDTVVVGATNEDSSSTSIDNTPDETAPDAGAAYVFVRSSTTWSQQAYLKASQVSAGDNFGGSVSVSGDTVVVGAFLEDSGTEGVNSTSDEGANDAGAAYVFVRNSTTWSQQAYLKASQVSIGDNFGISVAISGDTVIIGATGEDSSTNQWPDESFSASGAAYVYLRSNTTWNQQAYLKASNPGAGDLFGFSVAVSGNTAVVGATGEDSSTAGINRPLPDESANAAGAAYVFLRSGPTWNQQAYLKASQVSTGDNFGSSVAVSGDTVVVGASLEDSSTSGINSIPNEGEPSAGAAYVYVRSSTTWSQQAYLKASQVSIGDNFGISVAISADTVVVGASLEDSGTTDINSMPDEGAPDAGAAFMLVRVGSTWSQQAFAKPSLDSLGRAAGAGDAFGHSVAVSGDTVVVGAPFEDSGTTGVNTMPNEAARGAGAAYVFVRNGATWSQQAYLKASQVNVDDYFGYSVAVSGNTVVVGAYAEDSSSTGINSASNEAASAAGAAYVFLRNGATWSQHAYLKAHQVSAGDQFGYSVAVSEDTVVIGAYAEDSNSTGINSMPNEAASGAGAAYVFVRSDTTWSQQAYLKASQVSASDWFGYSVAVSEGTVVVGAYAEDSNSTGINSMPNEAASGAGAAYVFVRSDTTWSQQAYLKASQVSASDWFGCSVAVSGDTVVVGAIFEDSSTTGINSMPDENAEAAGATYVFVRSDMTWSQQAYLKASNTGADDRFGISVAVSGDTVVVGAQLEDSSTTGINSLPDENAPWAGAAYVYVRHSTTWRQQAYLKGGQVSANDQFGFSVAVNGNTVVVGVNAEDSGSTGINSTPDESAGQAGAAYIFTGLGPSEIGLGGNGVNIVDGDTTPAALDHTDFDTAAISSTVTRIFTISNSGVGALDLTGSPLVAFNGSSAFAVAQPSSATIMASGGTQTFAVTFAPTVPGMHTATLSITSTDDDENPFTFDLSGTALSTTDDSDADGLNDWAEFTWAALGFDWQVSQPTLVSSLFSNLGNAQSNLNSAGYVSGSQVQSLNIGVPLLQRHPVTGVFTLTIGLQKSTTLQQGSFSLFPMTAPQTSVNGAGKLEFQFTAPDNAAFFRLLAE